MKLQAGTLAYALAISLIIGMITASVLISEHYNRLLIHRDAVREEVVRNANSGMVYLCGVKSSESEYSTDIDLFNRGKDSVRLQVKPWGVYDILISDAHTGNEEFKRIAIAGYTTDSTDKYALWLADMDRPLRVCGETKLKGKCYLPHSGIERAYLEGQSFSGRELVQGSVTHSSRFVPQYNKERYALLEKLLAGEIQSHDSVVAWQEFITSDSVFCSFDGPVCVVNEKVPLVISDIRLEGQIRICSQSSITVRKSAHLQNVLLIANEIRIEDETRGTFQVIARDSLILGEKVVLEYPSSISLCSNSYSPLQTGITIHKECLINGDIFAANTSSDFNRKLLIDLAPGTIVRGNIYCSSSIDLKGSVYGTVTCQKFSLSTNSAFYENTLLNAVIESAPTTVPGGCMVGDFRRKEVINWPE
jgi:hypothetical protein